jgi:hypothetical protein
LKLEAEAERDVRRLAGEIAANVFLAWQIATAGKVAEGRPAELRLAAVGLVRDIMASDEAIRLLAQGAEAGMRRILEGEIPIVLQEKRRKMDQADEYIRNKSLLSKDGEALKDHYIIKTEALLEDRCVRVDAETRERLDQLEDAFRRFHDRSDHPTVKRPRPPPV